MSGNSDPELLYLELDDVLAIYADIFGLTDQEARDRIGNEVGLSGAMGRPQNYAHDQGADIALQAAVLAHGIAEGQHVLEGNKRATLVALRTFLSINANSIDVSQKASSSVTPNRRAVSRKRRRVGRTLGLFRSR